MNSAPDVAELLKIAENWAPDVRNAALERIRALTEGDVRAWYCMRGRSCDGQPHEGYNYPHARGDQWPPPGPGSQWFVWFLSGGRGSGKTRTGAEYTRKMAARVGRMALIAPTGADVRDTMIEGESGLQYVCAMAGEKIKWEPSKRRITFSNGAIATTFSAEEPDRLRGPQFGYAWLDEPAHMPLIEDVWSNLLFGLRLGTHPHITLTSTPLPTKWVKEVQAEKDTKVVRVSTYANIHNLAPTFAKRIKDRYEGTRLGKQELHGQLLQDVEGALWNAEIIHHDREFDYRECDRIVVSIDPAGSNNRRSDETGIVVVGAKGEFGYVLEDASGKYSPNGWAQRAIELYETYNADAILAEKNYGGDMVRTTIQSGKMGNGQPFDGRVIVATASKSKKLRAEPIVAKYEQGRVFHVGLTLADLEDEMLTWVPGRGDSPNRVDALVWGMTEVLKVSGVAAVASPVGSTLRRGASRGLLTRRML